MAATYLADVPEQWNLAEAFLDAHVREGRGDAIAIRTATETLSYAQVSEAAHRFAGALATLGVDPEQRVIIGLPDIPSFASALFGTLMRGSAVVMVNCHLKPAEIAYFYAYTRAKAAVVHVDHLDIFVQAAEEARDLRHLVVVGAGSSAEARANARIGERIAKRLGERFGEVVVSAYEDLCAAAPARSEIYPTHRDDAAIWLFSGGTTGRPKAVLQSHGSFANTTRRYAHEVLGMSASDITLSVPKLYFGYATGANLLFPFSVGGSCILFPERCTADALFEHIARHRPSILINVPTMVQHMVGHAEAAAQDLSCLRFATSAGEALPVELYERWKAAFGVELLDGLGTAEMWHIFVSNRPDEVKPGTLGKVVPGFTLEVRDDDGRVLAPGEVGWLWVRGESRAIGYWQTMPKSVDAFFGPWYRSGDMVSVDEDGFVSYCGRGDDMLKVGGKWLAPGEVENCLLTHPEVRECAVVGALEQSGLVKPHAYVVAHARREGLGEELRAYVRRQLEPYKAPRAVFFVDDMPRTHLGKIDRGKLRRPGS